MIELLILKPFPSNLFRERSNKQLYYKERFNRKFVQMFFSLNDSQNLLIPSLKCLENKIKKYF